MTNPWIKLPQPTGSGSVLTFTGGVPIGLLLSLTYSQSSVISGGDDWTHISAVVPGGWTSIAAAV